MSRSRLGATRTRTRGGALPNLIVIGAGRCGTTSLHRYLDLHPEIGMSAVKELNFFSGGIEPAAEPQLHDAVDVMLAAAHAGTWSYGLDWYRKQFDPSMAIRGDRGHAAAVAALRLSAVA